MKKTPMIPLSLCIVLAFVLPALAADCSKCPAGGTQVAAAEGKSAPEAGMEKVEGYGATVKIHEGKKDGWSFAFEILPMPAAGATHHLMVYIKDPAGKPFTGAKVGFDVGSPVKGKKDLKVMAMAMGDAYGGNVNLAEKGRYTIRIRAVGEGRDVLYGFEYEVK
jgi:hypothetical protein